MTEKTVDVIGFVKCKSCGGELHRLQPGTAAPEYFCPAVGRTIQLREGDEIVALTPKGRQPMPGRRTDLVRAVFGLLALIVATGTAVYAFRQVPSWALAIFVFLIAMHVVGQGIPDVITSPKKTERVLFFALYPAICAALLYVSYRWWHRMWLSVVVAIVVAAILNAATGVLLFGASGGKKPSN